MVICKNRFLVLNERGRYSTCMTLSVAEERRKPAEIYLSKSQLGENKLFFYGHLQKENAEMMEI